jgi:N-methylhydantoinase A
MANAARVHAIESGKTVGARTLIAFGGAAPVHAARVADKLDIGRVVVPPNAGVGSAVGFLRAPVSYEVTRSFYQRLGDLDVAAVDALVAAMRAEAHAVVEPGAQGRALSEAATVFMRYVGQGHEVAVPIPLAASGLGADPSDALRRGFEDAYHGLYDRVIPGLEVEVLTWVLRVATAAVAVTPPADGAAPFAPEPTGSRDLLDGDSGTFETVPQYRRHDLAAGARIDGPAVIVEKDTATVVARGFRARLDGLGYIVMERQQGAGATP